MSLATRLESLIAQKPGNDAASLAAMLRARAIDASAVEATLAQLLADGRIEYRESGPMAGYHLAGVLASTTEYQGRNGPDPTRFGDWENKGICVDF